jgi:hypothetical protein
MSETMVEPRVDDRVSLIRDLPELDLHRGDLGAVRRLWFAPCVTFEVEFVTAGSEHCLRALLRPEQIERGTLQPQDASQ